MTHNPYLKVRRGQPDPKISYPKANYPLSGSISHDGAVILIRVLDSLDVINGLPVND